MKTHSIKTITFISSVLYLCAALFTACATTSSTENIVDKNDEKELPLISTYRFNLSNATTKYEMQGATAEDNWSGYDATLDFTSYTANRKMQVGDTVNIRAKIQSNVAIKELYALLVDTSTVADEWLELSKPVSKQGYLVAKDIRPKIAFEINITMDITEEQIKTCFVYLTVSDDCAEEAPVLSIFPVCESTKTYYNPEKIVWESEKHEGELFDLKKGETSAISFKDYNKNYNGKFESWEIGKVFSVDAYDKNIKGYKYLNIEMYSPDYKNNYYTYIRAQSVGHGVKGNILETNINISKEYQTYQIPITAQDEYWNDLDLDVIRFNNFDDTTKENVEGSQIYIRKISVSNEKIKQDTTKDFVVWEAEDKKGKEIIITKPEETFYLNLYGNDLSGYKYLNIEAYCPNEGLYWTYFNNWVDGECVYDSAILFNKKNKIVTTQSTFGTANGTWKDWNNGNPVWRPSTINKLDGMSIRIIDNSEGSWNWKDALNVPIYVKKIYATNTKINADTSQDFTIFESSEKSGTKIIAPKDQGSFNLRTGKFDLSGYQYINIEVYSPADNLVNFEGFGLDEKVFWTYNRICEKDSVRTFQATFGTNNYIWTDWNDGKTLRKISKSNTIEEVHIAVAEENGTWKGTWDSPLYVKRIYATNTPIK